MCRGAAVTWGARLAAHPSAFCRLPLCCCQYRPVPPLSWAAPKAHPPPMALLTVRRRCAARQADQCAAALLALELRWWGLACLHPAAHFLNSAAAPFASRPAARHPVPRALTAGAVNRGARLMAPHRAATGILLEVRRSGSRPAGRSQGLFRRSAAAMCRPKQPRVRTRRLLHHRQTAAESGCRPAHHRPACRTMMSRPLRKEPLCASRFHRPALMSVLPHAFHPASANGCPPAGLRLPHHPSLRSQFHRAVAGHRAAQALLSALPSLPIPPIRGTHRLPNQILADASVSTSG